ncbi:type VI secretion system Vgr family protein [Metapseudomonas boanensis]|uniref:Type VI secretion system tip protein VgrG n=1 Tax=Metapseudomonas boanensis TaxID=2822138 RepID=A0ABS5XD80_9GAMM|nr:type VI secretion system tip protein VgrG [Pseudomonas boanensis]MBT8765646.1 type VI secretion system tip protein VgrG [Pseudomonas boanensis]
MNDPATLLFDHSRHQLRVRNLDAPLDVLAFSGEEGLSQGFRYTIEFTSTVQNLPVAQILNRDASFSLYAPPIKPSYATTAAPPALPLRVLRGVITRFNYLSTSADETRYSVLLEPRLALSGLGKACRIFQQQNVPEILESVLRERHAMRGQDFLFKLSRDYPRREQVMQYGESDRALIERLCAEVGIWHRVVTDDRLGIDVLEFCDDQRHYQFDVSLPLRPLSGLDGNGQDGVWQLQSNQRVVERQVAVRAYDHQHAAAHLDGEFDLTHGDATTCGEAYHYAEPYTELGDRYAQNDVETESGYHFARLAHERYLNARQQLSGVSSSATLAPGQVLKVAGDAPEVFARGVVITSIETRAARDRSLEVAFTAIPYSETVCFRPPLREKPVIAGTLPAHVVSPETHPTYAEINAEGKYRVRFCFDRDPWPAGRDSLWLRLARPYAGDTHGLHMPLLAGTGVGVAFEQGDPDKPYIAHAFHDSQHPDLVTLKNYKRNVLRTPANNKLRLDDTRGQEHIKLSTEHSGKSQLNLGHLVDSQKQKRGAGFELRSDGHGALRAGKGLFISADQQPRAQGQVLDMQEAVTRLQQAGEQLQSLSTDAQNANADPADVQAQLRLLSERLDQLNASVALLSAPQGMALSSGDHLQLAAQRNLMLNAGHAADISVVKRLFIGVGEGLSLFVRKLGMKLIANQGPISLQAQNDRLELLARHGLDITSTEDEIRIVAKQKITLNAGGSYITLDPYGIESGTQGEHLIKAVHFDCLGPASMGATHPDHPKLESSPTLRLSIQQAPNAPGLAWAGMPYTLYADGAPLKQGVLDTRGEITIEHAGITRQYHLKLGNGVTYQLPVPSEYRNPDQAHLANRGLHHHRLQAASQAHQPAAHTDHRLLYASVLEGLGQEGKPDEPGPTQSGPGKWVTQEVDYHGTRNAGQMFLNRLTSMGDEGRVFGSEGKDYENTKRALIQAWEPLTVDEQHLAASSAAHRYGELRQIEQIYLEGPDSWHVSGKSCYWQPVTADTVYETKEPTP